MGRRVRGLWQLLITTLVATALQAAALWLWHVPSLFELALERPLWHVAQHASFLRHGRAVLVGGAARP